MQKINFKSAFDAMKRFCTTYTPEILIGMGCTAFLSATVSAVVATSKAKDKIEQKKEELKVEKLEAKEVIKVSWPYYIPPALLTITGGACIFGASKINYKRNAALAAAYTVAETSLTDYKEQVANLIGPKKEKIIQADSNQQELERHPIKESSIINTKYGNTLMYDLKTGRYFYSDIDHIKRTLNDLDAKRNRGDQITLNDFYYANGLEEVDFGDYIGYDYPDEDGNDNPNLIADTTRFEGHILPDESQSCIMIILATKVLINLKKGEKI